MARLHELWAELQASKSQTPPGGLTLRLLYSNLDVRLFAAVTQPDKSAALIVEIPDAHRPKDLVRISTRTFEAVLASFPGLPAGKSAIGVTLRQPDYLDLFSLLGEEVMLALQRSGSTADACRAVVRCIERWRRFVEKNRRSLSEEEVRGLIGELVVLSRASLRFGQLAAVQAWQGQGGLRDFELPDFTVEVKTYQFDSGAAVRINDPLQLEGTPDRRAYLGVVRLARTQAHGRSLPEFVQAMEAILGVEAEAIDLFRDRLATAGYLSSQAAQFVEKYSAAAPQVFEVRDGFPRIRPDQAPSSVRDIHFSIILTGVASFAVNADVLLGASAGLEAE
jgi:hypothetical protein